MVRDTPPSQDVSTYQIWNPYLKESRRYAPDTKRDGRTDGQAHGRTVQLLYASQSSFGGIKNNLSLIEIITSDSSIYTMNHPKVIVSYQVEEPIIIQLIKRAKQIHCFIHTCKKLTMDFVFSSVPFLFLPLFEDCDPR